jgi:hypothetical protein
MASSPTDKEIFEAFIHRAGLSLTEAQKLDLLVGYGHIKAMAERMRTGGPRPREAEPAIVFKADN